MEVKIDGLESILEYHKGEARKHTYSDEDGDEYLEARARHEQAVRVLIYIYEHDMASFVGSQVQGGTAVVGSCPPASQG